MEQTAKKPKKSKKKITLVVIALIIAALFGSCMYTSTNYKPTLLGVKVSVGEMKSSISTTGVVASSDLDEFVVPETTNVKKVHFKIGDMVKIGDLIVEYDHSDALEVYKRTAIAYEQSRLNLVETERNYYEIKEDIDQVTEDISFLKEKWEYYDNAVHNPLSEDTQLFNSYYAKWESAKSKKEALEKSVLSDEAVKSLQLSFELAKMNLDNAEKAKNSLPANIIALRDGVVETLAVRDLNPAPKGTLAIAVRTSTSDTVNFDIGRYDIGKITVNQLATVKVSGIEYTGVVSQINPVASADQYVKAKIRLDKPEGVVPGVPGDVEIETYYSESTTTLPIEAVKTDRTGDYCFVLKLNKDGTTYIPVKTYITIGNTSNTAVEVLDGLEPDMLVASNPPKGIETITVCNVVPQP